MRKFSIILLLVSLLTGCSRASQTYAQAVQECKDKFGSKGDEAVNDCVGKINKQEVPRPAY
jgi:hypothetical protein